jgi:integrase
VDEGSLASSTERRRIGLREIRALGEGETIWDSVVIGFGARRQRSDAVSYVLSYRTQTRRKRLLTIGRHGSPWLPDEARQEARRLLGVVAAGGDPMLDREIRRGASMTVAELCDRWIDDSEAGRLLTRRRRPKRPATIATDRSRVTAHIKPLLGALPVVAITRQDVERLMHAVMSGKTRQRTKLPKLRALSNIRGGTGAASRTVSMFRALMVYAVRLDLRPDNPASGVVRPADNRRDRRLSDEEYAALGAGLVAAEDDGVWMPALAAIRFLLVTGWRRGEVLNLRWAEVDLPRRTARLADTKTGSSMRPLAEPACAILRDMGRSGTYVFQALGGDMPMQGFPRLWSRTIHCISGLPKDVTPHVLRHSLASLAADLGYSDATIAGLLGHAGHSITRRYIHSADSALLAAADRVAEETIRLMDRKRDECAVTAGPADDAGQPQVS